MSKNKPTDPKHAIGSKPVPVVKTKGPRSDRLERRVRADLSKPDSIPYNLRGAIPGQVDRGLASSPFGVITRSKRTGELISTRHRDMFAANIAATDRRGHHNLVRIVDHSQNLEPIKVQDLTVVKTDIDDLFLEETAA